MLDRGKKIVAVKRGKLGAIAATPDEVVTVAAHDVSEIDPTGAGDCFCGILIGLMDQGIQLKEAIVAANAGVAMHVTRRGPMEWNPTYQEIQTFLKEQRVDDIVA